MPATRLRGMSKSAGLAVLAGLLALVLAFLLAAEHYAPPQPAKALGPAGDAYTYEHIVERMKAGEPYYQAAHEELLANHYGTRSVFNWRTPLYPTLLSLLPRWQEARFLMLVLACCAALCILKPILDAGGLVAGIPVALALTPVIAGCANPALAMYSELPCGLLILLAVSFHAFGWRKTAIMTTMLALFIRELAAPMVLILAADALWHRRKSDALLLAVLLVGYGAYFAWHAHMVALTLGPMDKAYPSGWMQFGGLGFVLATVHSNATFYLMPLSLVAVALPIAFLGLAAWPKRTGLLALVTAGAYAAAFMIVGKPFNNYWGLIYTPLLAVGLGWGPLALVDLGRVLIHRASARDQRTPSSLRGSG